MTSIFRDKLLEGKVAVLTGGGSGINLAIAERYAEHGAKVVLVGRTLEKVEGAAAAIVARGGTATGLSADVRDFAAVAAVMARTKELYGEIDLVVCGAAGNFPAPAAALSANGFKSVVDIDLNGTFNTCRAAFDHLRKPGASILSISATQAFSPMALQAHVCAAKAGVDMLTKVLAVEWGQAGVRVNAIAPGPVDDTEGMRRIAPTPEIRGKIEAAIPLGRYATKSEIADIALFLATPAAAYVTGAVWVADGGQSLQGSGALLAAMMS
jgi:NAD(P)-dependent dehydrogenase (short-subunit alcohol dehydrogenase family)